MTFLLDSLSLNIVITVAIGLVFIVLYFVQRSYVKKHEETINKWLLALIYFLFLLVLFGAIVGLMFVWNFDFTTFFQGFSNNIASFFAGSVTAIIASAITIFVWMLILKITKISLKRLGDKPGAMQKRRKTISKVSISIINYTLAIISIIILLAIWGVNVLPALAGLGILGLVVGLGAQKFIQDLIAGFFIIFEHHFDVGDVIEVSGFKGTVTDIGLKTTKIRNWKGEIRIYNNGEVNTLINYSKNPSLAIVEFGIAYEEDINRTIEVLNNAFPEFSKNYPEIIIEAPSIAGVIALNASSVDLRVIVKTLNEQHYGVERALRKFIKETLDANNIEKPFPQVVVTQK